MHIHHGLDHIPKRATWIVGIDEAGRGPVAGPLAVGLVLIRRRDVQPLHKSLPLVRDSKKLSPGKRDSVLEQTRVFEDQGQIIARTIFVEAGEVDTRGVGQCLHESIIKGLEELVAYAQIDPKSVFVYLDGSLKAPALYRQQTVKGGDNKIFSIALASIYAKVARDRLMEQYDLEYPLYNFYAHKGYGTIEHMKRIKEHGPCPIHRRSYLKKVLAK